MFITTKRQDRGLFFPVMNSVVFQDGTSGELPPQKRDTKIE